MPNVLARNSWALIFRSALAVLLGLTAVSWPAFTTRALVALFGAYAVLDGLFAVAAAAWASAWRLRRWPFLAEGGISCAVGALALLHPGLTEFKLVSVIATWAILTGACEVIAAAALPLERWSRGLLGLNGIASALLGFLLFVFSGADALVVVWLIGLYANIFGVLLLIFALRLRAWRHRRLGIIH